MLKYLIYLVTMFIIIYFQFVGTDMQKNSDLKNGAFRKNDG